MVSFSSWRPLISSFVLAVLVLLGLGSFSGSRPVAHAQPMTDPSLSWNTFLGGSGYDNSMAVAVDDKHNMYIVGYSDATWGTPVRAHTSQYDAFVAKLDSNGVLQWNTFLGGSGVDIGAGLVIDGNGNTYVTGYSDATWGTPKNAYAGGNDAFVAKLDSNGALLWNTFLGSSENDQSQTIQVDGSGNIYLGGISNATWGTPIRAYSGGGDAFIAKLDPAGTLVWNTFLGGNGLDITSALVLDSSRSIYVGGMSDATWGTPVRSYTNSRDAFAARLDANGALVWNTFLGGSGVDEGSSVAADENGNVYVVGRSTATWGSPVIPYTAGLQDVLVAKLNSNGVLTWNTFLGGTGYDYGNALAVDGVGNLYVAGESNTTWGTPIDSFTGGTDGFAARVDSNGALVWNTFLGGIGHDMGEGLALDLQGQIYVTGGSDATWGTPIRNFAAFEDAFVAKISDPEFCSATKPARPALAIPVSNATVATLQPKLKWNGATCAVTYNVTIKNTSSGKIVDKKTGLTKPQYKTKVLAHQKKYQWFVQACNTNGCTKSKAWKFTVQ